MKACPRCSKELEDNATICRYCNKVIATEKIEGNIYEKRTESEIPWWIVAILAAGMLIFAVFRANLHLVHDIGVIVIASVNLIYSMVMIIIVKRKKRNHVR